MSDTPVEPKWRVIVRFSLQGDAPGTPVRQKMVGHLKQCDFVNTGNTGSWTCDTTDPQCAAEKLCEILTIAADIESAGVAVPDGTDLDHMWIYIENILPKKSKTV